MRFPLYLILIATLCAIPFAAESNAELITFDNPWGDPGFNLTSQGMSGVEVVFSIENLMITEIEVDGIPMKNVQIPGAFLPNNAGAPNLPGDGRGIAIPRGATATLTILDSETEVIDNIEIAPAPPIPLETD
ncbi:MAG: hypothetical protein GF307_01035, partial [candidate division Zixibacteria bacterium]|nr:hypothetical protein [candidate division Zixibacteria bacterium]